ncbi:hypothetical protein ABZ565_15430 [Streptomyces sp. NPDC016469]|uniref:hypothetical protein n=1 Tax=Streptomyces sp. NPDC016469 TaxID=3157191 RepID=UPI0033E8EE92
MTPETVVLLQGGALTLVNLMATDAWTHARERFARLLSRGTGDGDEVVLERLDTARREVITAHAEQDAKTLTAIEGEWLLALRRALVADPEVLAGLRSFVADFGAPPFRGAASLASGTFHNSPVQGSGTQTINYGSGSIGGAEQ